MKSCLCDSLYDTLLRNKAPIHRVRCEAMRPRSSTANWATCLRQQVQPKKSKAKSARSSSEQLCCPLQFWSYLQIQFSFFLHILVHWIYSWSRHPISIAQHQNCKWDETSEYVWSALKWLTAVFGGCDPAGFWDGDQYWESLPINSYQPWNQQTRSPKFSVSLFFFFYN